MEDDQFKLLEIKLGFIERQLADLKQEFIDIKLAQKRNSDNWTRATFGLKALVWLGSLTVGVVTIAVAVYKFFTP